MIRLDIGSFRSGIFRGCKFRFVFFFVVKVLAGNIFGVEVVEVKQLRKTYVNRFIFELLQKFNT